MTDHTPVIFTQDLDKTFGPVQSLDRQQVESAPREVYGYLGPDSAGKSVTMRILLGLVRHDAGTVQVFGKDAWKYAVELQKRLADVPDQVELWPNLTGGEAIDMFL